MGDTTIEIFGGLNVIGGNKICITASNDAAVLLDFGLDFSINKKFTDSFLKLREKEFVLDGLFVGLLPKPSGTLVNLYRKDLMLHCKNNLLEAFGIDYTPEAMPIVTDVAISHVHTDHMGLIRYIHGSINLVLGTISDALLDHFTIVNKATSLLRDVKAYKSFFKLVGGKIVVDDDETTRNVTKLDNGQSTDVANGGINIQFFETDHSVPGAGGFLLQDKESGKKIVYTGDIRVHGPLGAKAQAFIAAAKEFEPDVLIIEGTRLARKGEESYYDDEESVKNKIFEILDDINKTNDNALVLFECSLRDVWRFKSFYEAACMAGRKLVVDADIYLLIAACQKAGVPEVSSIDLNNVLIYLFKAGSFSYANKDYSYNPEIVAAFTDPNIKLKAGAGKYNALNFKMHEHVKAEDIRNDPGKYVMYLSFYSLNELPDLRPPQGSHYIKSMSEPFDDEAAIDDQKRLNWLEAAGIPEENRHQVHCSGHADPETIKSIITTIAPRVVIPVHTEHPEMFLEMGLPATIDVKLLETGEKFVIP